MASHMECHPGISNQLFIQSGIPDEEFHCGAALSMVHVAFLYQYLVTFDTNVSRLSCTPLILIVGDKESSNNPQLQMYHLEELFRTDMYYYLLFIASLCCDSLHTSLEWLIIQLTMTWITLLSCSSLGDKY